jgi:SAM-dependent methyltransferase
MGLYAEHVLPRLTDLVMRRPDLDPIRARVSGGLSGEVLEIGFGSGLNVPHYPPTVAMVLAVDPATVGRNLAAGRVAASPVPVQYVGLDGQDLPLATGSVDHVLSTWTLCTIPDVERALREIRRVLRPGGMFHFAEHGRSPDPAVCRWQDRLTPLQRRIAGGCHLNRPIADLITQSGLRIEALTNYHVKGPRAFGYTFEGRAAAGD